MDSKSMKILINQSLLCLIFYSLTLNTIWAQSTANVQVIHNSADPAAEVVDVYVNGALALDDFEFRTATPFLSIPSGVPIDLGVAPSNSSGPADIIAVVPFDSLATGESYVLIATGVIDPASFDTTTNAGIGFNIKAFAPAETGTTTGNVALNGYHGATDAPAVDILANGTPLITNLAFGSFSGYVQAPPAVYTLDVTPAGANSTVVASFEADLSGLGGGAATVFASGFLNPANNQNGAAFGLFAALPDGTVIELPAAQPDPEFANVQIIHNAADPGAAAVDIYVDGALAIDDFAFRTATPYIQLPAGVEIVVGVAGGNSTGAGDILASFPLTLAADENYVVMATGVLDPTAFDTSANSDIGFTLEIFTPSLTGASDTSSVALLAYHGSTDAPAVDVLANGGVLVPNISYSEFAGYLEVPAAAYQLDVTPAGDNATIVASYDADLSGLGGGAGVVFASGFLNPAANQDGEAFGLFAALPDGIVIELPAAQPDPEFAHVQIIHNAADPAAAAVDIYVDGALAIDDFAFRAATPYIQLPAGVEIVVGVAGGNSTGAGDILASFPLTLAADENYVVMATGVLDPSAFDTSTNSDIGFTLEIFTPSLKSASDTSNVALLAYHGSTDAPAVDVLANGGVLVPNISYSEFAGYLEVPAAAYRLDVTPAGDNATIVASYDADLSGLGGGAGVVFASGFLNPDNNQHGEAFGLFAALPDGTVIALPAAQCKTIFSFSLVDTEADTVISAYDPIVDGAEIDLTGLPHSIGIIANACTDLPVGSVKLSLSGAQHQNRTENVAPYALFGDFGGDYLPWEGDINEGAYTLSATVYTEEHGQGMSGDPLEISFTFIRPTPTAQVQIIHNAADPAASFVDIYVNGELALDDFEFCTATPYLDLPANTALDIGVAPGNSHGVEDVIANFPLAGLEENTAYVVVATGVLDTAQFDTSVNTDIGFTLKIFAPARTAGTDQNVDFITYHGATDAPAVDVLANGAPLITGLSYSNFEPYISVPAATYTLAITPAGANETIVAEYIANLSGLGGGSAVVFASGFLNPANNQNGKPFGLYAALPDGTVVCFPAVSCNLQIESFTLIDPVSNEPIAGYDPIEDGAVIDLASISSTAPNIRANVCNPDGVGSVVFSLSGSQHQNRTENVAPYALFGDSNGNYHPWAHPPQAGDLFVLEATPYAEAHGSGDSGPSTSISFSFEDSHASAAESNNAGSTIEGAFDALLELFPNPSSRVVNVLISGVESYGRTNLIIRDMKGSIVKKATVTENTVQELEVDNLEPGIYIIQVQGNGYNMVRKMIRQ